MARFSTILGVLAMTLSTSFSMPGTAQSGTYTYSGNTYAAIAFSPATGKRACAYNYGSRASAERAALKTCGADDARIVTWANNGYCALALSDDNLYWGTGSSYGDGASNVEARNHALKQCRDRATSARIVLCVCSLDVDPEINRD